MIQRSSRTMIDVLFQLAASTKSRLQVNMDYKTAPESLTFDITFWNEVKGHSRYRTFYDVPPKALPGVVDEIRLLFEEKPKKSKLEDLL